MEILNQMQNGNFEIIDKNKIKNVHTGEIIKGATQLLNDYMGDHVLIETYSSGVLAVRKQSYQIDIKFIKNNGDALIDLSLDDLNEMGNKIYDVNAIVCSSGVLVAYNFFKGDRYVYYTYSGAQIPARDFDDLRARIAYFEADPAPTYTNTPTTLTSTEKQA